MDNQELLEPRVNEDLLDSLDGMEMLEETEILEQMVY